MMTGMIGVPDSADIRTAPDRIDLISKLCDTVDSGKIPTSSPRFSASTAASSEVCPSILSTGMCFIPRRIPPTNGFLKASAFAMYRTYRLCRRNGMPAYIKSR